MSLAPRHVVQVSAVMSEGPLTPAPPLLMVPYGMPVLSVSCSLFASNSWFIYNNPFFLLKLEKMKKKLECPFSNLKCPFYGTAPPL